MFSLANSEAAIKTFVFEKQQTQQSEFVQEEVDLRSPMVDLSRILAEYASPERFNISIYDPKSNQFQLLQDINAENGLVPKNYLEPNIILVRYRKREGKKEHRNSQGYSDEESPRNRQLLRSKERSIAEVIALVKHWRNLHQNEFRPGNPKKKMNLQQAAREVGISKKSLDDYYCQLRLAELHNFNFIDNMNERMGKLRSFVKQHRVDEAARIRHHKHPKNLRIIQEFKIDAKMQEYIMQEKELGSVKQESSFMQQKPIFSEEPENKIDNLEKAFYDNFEFLIDEPSDPFLFQQADLKTRKYESDSEGSLLI